MGVVDKAAFKNARATLLLTLGEASSVSRSGSKKNSLVVRGL
jgi:hypothetical protein